MRLKPQLATLLVLIVGAAPSAVLAQQPSTFTVYAQGLNAPRGLAFGPDRNLYVAEAGTGGSIQTDRRRAFRYPRLSDRIPAEVTAGFPRSAPVTQ